MIKRQNEVNLQILNDYAEIKKVVYHVFECPLCGEEYEFYGIKKQMVISMQQKGFKMITSDEITGVICGKCFQKQKGEDSELLDDFDI
jgi:transcription elongation factor Elf1